MSDQFTVDVAITFNADETINLAFNNVPVDDVESLLLSLGTPKGLDNFCAALEASLPPE